MNFLYPNSLWVILKSTYLSIGKIPAFGEKSSIPTNVRKRNSKKKNQILIFEIGFLIQLKTSLK